jgi:cell division septal protein FtsQ
MKIIKPVILILVIVSVITGLWQGIVKTDLIKLKDIKVVGADPATEIRLRKIITIRVGSPLWSKSVENQADILKTDPWVESAQVRRVFPNTLVVEIKERTPLAVVGNTRGQFKYVDKENNIIDSASPEKIGKYPILLGEKLSRDQSLREVALGILKNLPPDGILSLHDLSDIQFDDEHGFQIRLAKSGMVVDIGKEDIPLHMDRARRVVQYLDQHNINASRVDSDYVKKVLVKVRKGR